MWGKRLSTRTLVDVRHERAEDIEDEAVEATEDPSEWRVLSSAGDEYYDVRKHVDVCRQRSCRDWNKCFGSGCNGLCAHMFTCECPDDNLLCKHIHKVRIVTQRAALSPERAASTSRADEHWRLVANVEQKVKRMRGTLKSIGDALDRYDAETLSGIIDEANNDLEDLDAKLYCHCQDFESGVNDDDDDDDDEDDEDDDD